MKTKNVLIFLLGVVTGAGGMYLSFKSINDKKVEQRVNDELFKNRVDQDPLTNPPEYEKKDDVVEAPEEKERDLTRYSEIISNKTDYTKAITKDKVTTMSDAIEEKVEKIVEKKPAKKMKVPKKITQEEFDSTPEDERKTLYYYADGVLADEDDQVYDPTETMGATNFKNFKSTYDTVYIFNYALDLMFEIMPCNSRYADIR